MNNTSKPSIERLNKLIEAVLIIYVPELTFSEPETNEITKTPDVETQSDTDDQLPYSNLLLKELTEHLSSELYDASKQSGSEEGEEIALPESEVAQSIVEQVVASYPLEPLSDLDLSLLVEDLLESFVDPEKASRLLRRVGTQDDEADEELLPPGICELCERGPMRLTFHHLIPKKTHSKMLKRKYFTRDELNRGATICRPCHSTVHRVHDHETLAREFNTVEKLKEDEEIVKWIAYARKQKIREK